MISVDAVTRLNAVYSALAEVLYEWHMANGTPYVSIDTLTDGNKRVNFGETFEEFKYPSANSYIAGATTYIGRGDFTVADFFGSWGYKSQSVVIASDEVTIDGGVLSGDNSLYNTRTQRYELPTITRVESQALRTYNKSNDLYLILPNVVYPGQRCVLRYELEPGKQGGHISGADAQAGGERDHSARGRAADAAEAGIRHKGILGYAAAVCLSTLSGRCGRKLL